ncbi:MAG: hypothetical protein WCP53_00255 [Verrucomicrobiota bacterium]
MSCLDLDSAETRIALMALDAELSLLHRLCTEQGMFFKALFPEAASDARRMRLHSFARKPPPNQSHFDRSYWNPKITVAQIQEIAREAERFQKEWAEFHATVRTKMFMPAAPAHMRTPLTLLDDELDDLALAIANICAQLARLPSVAPPLREMLARLTTTTS